MPDPDRRGAAAALVVVCLLGVLLVAVAPGGSSLERLTQHLWEFFRTDVPVAPEWMTPDRYGQLLNVAFFVPVGAVLAWWLRDQWGWALPAAVGLSFCIELVQRAPELARDSSLDDLACNTLGATFGVVAVVVVRSLSSR